LKTDRNSMRAAMIKVSRQKVEYQVEEPDPNTPGRKIWVPKKASREVIMAQAICAKAMRGDVPAFRAAVEVMYGSPDQSIKLDATLQHDLSKMNSLPMDPNARMGEFAKILEEAKKRQIAESDKKLKALRDVSPSIEFTSSDVKEGN